MRMFTPDRPYRWLIALLVLVAGARADDTQAPFMSAPAFQSETSVLLKSKGCQSCHSATDSATMHDAPSVRLGCSDCHGGDSTIERSAEVAPGSAEFRTLEAKAHVQPRHPEEWKQGGGNPERSYTLLNRESPVFIRFFNPGDYRVAREACGACHLEIIEKAQRSLMATDAMFYGGASYNNGLLPFKNYILGEGYTREGVAVRILGPVLADPAHAALAHGVVPSLGPLPPWEEVKPSDPLRIFEAGGRVAGNLFPETGLPNMGGLQLLNEPGRPDIHASTRGPGTGARIAVPLITIEKTRLNDPLMWFLGTNDQPGDYRSSGCSACHVVYANDRDPAHSGPYARYGHDGRSHTLDPTITHAESGHPLEHRFTRSIPTSQCIVCHMHQPNMFLNTFMGFTMWDYESDAPAMWPKVQRYPSAEEVRAINDRNPEGAAPRGNWGAADFLRGVSDLNPQLTDTQFADYHGHGWNFRAVFKRDRHGTLLDAASHPVSDTDPEKFQKAVQLSSIHMDKGMQCVDCHFAQDAHGNGYLYGEVAAAVEIDCIDCHGTIRAVPTLRTSGPAAPPGGSDLSLLRNPDGRKRFEWRGAALYQRSLLDSSLEWRVKLVKDSVDPASPDYNVRSAQAKLMSRDTQTQHWGLEVPDENLAHSNANLECYSCHTSWTTSCGGCHLPSETNWRTERHHYQGGSARVFSTYNPQVARDEMFMLGRRGGADGGKIAPVRSSSALVVSSTNASREHLYIQQPPIAASGFSSQAFNPHYPHTERTRETKTCEDCHLTAAGDNNAILAQLLLQGTNFINFIGYHAWVGTQSGVAAVQVTEWDEPQAVIGSYLQRYAYPDYFKRHQERGRQLEHAAEHRGGVVGCLQLRGEYVYAAEGARGLRVYDVANLANKDFSQPIALARIGSKGFNAGLVSQDASCVALPTNQLIAPARNAGALMRITNQERAFHPIYHYALITDRREGLILTEVDTLADGEPGNNTLTRALTWNPNGVLNGARYLVIGGHVVYIVAEAGLVILNMDVPLAPVLLSVVPLSEARAAALQFRYLFVTDARGLQSIDVTDPGNPRLVADNLVPLADAARVYVARTYAYVAAGAQGLALIDVEQPEHLRLVQLFNANGAITDARDVVVGTTNASLFAYIADGAGGLKVLQLTSPQSQPKYYGFSPEPKPELIASFRTRFPALALSKGLDRDRAVDETGHQIAVFGRRGSGPLTLEEMRKLYLDQDEVPWVAQPVAR
jgi:hypothetical protein